MKLSKIDIIISIFTIISVSTLSFLLYKDFTARIQAGNITPIGTIVYKNNIAQRKYGSQVIWENIKQHETVYNYDSIRTDSNSSSILTLYNGAEIALAENTLIVINMAPGDLTIDFTQGDITVAGSKNLKIATEDAIINADDSKINLKKEDNVFNLSVESGTAIVGGQIIDPNKNAIITGGTTEVKEKLFSNMIPAPGKYFIASSERIPVRFSWNSSQQAAQSIEISSSRTFGSILISANAQNNSFNTTLNSGIYFWRIRTLGNNPLYSDIQSFTILNDNRIVPLSPSDSQNFSFVSNPPIINISWDACKAASSYELLVSRDPDFNNVIQKLSPTNSNISLANLAEGEYYWKVRAIYPFINYDPLPYAPVRKFSITKGDTIIAPVLTNPGDSAQLSKVSLKNKPEIFSWTPANDTGKYELQISTDENFRNIIRKVDSNSLHVPVGGDLNVGTYYWRVLFIASNNQIHPSKTRSFQIVELEPVIPIHPPNNGLINTSSSNNVRFSWIDRNNCGNYQIEVYQNKELTQLLNSTRSISTTIEIPIDIKSNIFWRVILFDKQDNKITTSNTFTATIAGSLKKPEFTFPMENQNVDMINYNSLQFSWNRIEGASYYRLKLYQQLPEGPRLVFSNQVNTNSYSFTKLTDLTIGNFYAELEAAQNINNSVQYSDINRLYFLISLGKELVSPTITTPATIYVN